MKKINLILSVVAVAMTYLISSPAAAFIHTLSTVTFTNNTGTTADDLHIETYNPIVNPPAPINDNGATPAAVVFTGTDAPSGGKKIDLTNGSVPGNGGKTRVTWMSDSWLYHSSIDDWWWTKDGNSIGKDEVSQIDKDYASMPSNPDWTQPFALKLYNANPTGVSYSNLQIATGVPDQYFTPADYLSNMGSGTPVALAVPSSGVFAPGSTTVATFLVSPVGYTAISVQYGGSGALYGNAWQVPEPGTALLALAAAGLLIRRTKAGQLGISERRQFRKRKADTAA